VSASRLSPSTVLIAVAFAALALPSSSAAVAGRPKTELRAEGHSQHGGLVWEEWRSGGGHRCVALDGDGTGTYPRPLQVGDGVHRARFVLFRRQKPTEVTITAWHALDSRGYEAGRSEALPHTLRPRRGADGRITAWRVGFSVNLPPSYYMHVYVRWPAGKCGGPRHVLRTYSIGA
jgi:hypothetical protein